MPPVHGAELAVRSRRVITPDGERPACVHVADGRIERVAPFEEVPAGRPLVEAGDLAVLPGLVDTHVHVNEPGRTEWEGFASATRAAAAGGVTTIVDMPLNSIPPTISADALTTKRAAAGGVCHVDVGFWGGAVPSSIGHLRELHEAGVFGFKAFLCPSGVDEFPALDDEQVRTAMREIATFDGLLLVHAELPGPIEEAADRLEGADPSAYGTYVSSRPPEAEELAVAAVADAAEATGCRVHVLHVSGAGALARVGGNVSAETCPHYLTLTAEEVERGATPSSALRRSAAPTTASACGTRSAATGSWRSCPIIRRAPPS